MREKCGKNTKIREKFCLEKEKLQSGNMFTNNTHRFSGNIQEYSPIETGITYASINSGNISRLSKVISQPVYGLVIPGQGEFGQ
jgi:hypothetical protein